MRKVRLKKRKKINLKNKISILILLIIMCIILFLYYVNKKILPTLMKYAKVDTEKMAITIMSNSINDDVLNTLNSKNIFNITKNNEGEVSSVDFNPVIVNKVLLLTSSAVSNNLKNIEKGNIKDLTFLNTDEYNLKNLKNGVISEIPMGIITNNALLSNLGPKIPVKINLIGNVISSVKAKVKNYGINSAIVEVYAHIEVTEEVVIPFSTKQIKVENDIPIAIKIIQGKVPNYYNNNALEKNSSSLSIPIDVDN